MTAPSCCAHGAGEPRNNLELVVIGAGSAGFAAAIRGAELGARVMLVGVGTIGGTCVNVGCVPSKTLIRAVETLHQADAAARFAGIRAEATLGDWREVVAQKNALVSELRTSKYVDVLPAYDGVAYLEGEARLGPDGVRVNGRALACGKIVVATGASPEPPPIPGLDEVPYLTSTTAMELDRLPASLLVVGGGPVGCELGQMFARAGVKVTLLCRSRLLPDGEPEVSERLRELLAEEGLEVLCGVAYRGLRRTSTGVALSVERNGVEEERAAERVLVAAGRRPNTAGLGLKEAGVALDARGGVRVDDRLKTTNPAIYAAGDVTGRDMHVYMAAYGGRIAAENALNGDGLRYDARAMPAVTFTDPQAASVGLIEAAAREQGIEVKTAMLPLSYVPRAIAARDTRGLVKLVADGRTDRLVGAHLLAPEAGDSIQTAVLALKGGLTTSELAATLFPYLTTVEGLKLAAQAFEKDIAKLPCCAG
ncbi:MAG: mercury(II) reductase [Alphaproteobacteria bacterium]